MSFTGDDQQCVCGIAALRASLGAEKQALRGFPQATHLMGKDEHRQGLIAGLAKPVGAERIGGTESTRFLPGAILGGQ